MTLFLVVKSALIVHGMNSLTLKQLLDFSNLYKQKSGNMYENKYKWFEVMVEET